MPAAPGLAMLVPLIWIWLQLFDAALRSLRADTMPGSRIVSARNDRNAASNNCNQIQMSGTSMASPGAAGMAALVRQYYSDGFFPTGAAVAADAMTPSAALVKATLLNSTHAMAG